MNGNETFLDRDPDGEPVMRAFKVIVDPYVGRIVVMEVISARSRPTSRSSTCAPGVMNAFTVFTISSAPNSYPSTARSPVTSSWSRNSTTWPWVTCSRARR